MKKHIPKTWHITRIENRYGGGVPDVYICAEGKPFWLELKVTKNHRVDISAHQVAWHFAHSRANGVSFFLVSPLSSPTLYLFEGAHGRELLDQGLRVGVRGSGTGLQAGVGVRVRDFGSGFGVGEKGPGLSLLEVGRAKVKSEVLDKERIPDLSWSCNVPRETSKKGVDM